MIRRPPRSTQSRSSAASDVYKRQAFLCCRRLKAILMLEGIHQMSRELTLNTHSMHCQTVLHLSNQSTLGTHRLPTADRHDQQQSRSRNKLTYSSWHRAGAL
eukprot:TRINITY_DN131_c0_g1_i4.p2 TRINITY_DN131_c0_g1~~TRINITY_DN131_c0_g1_i4.p2  ORF type:complete len:102 (-),score=25.16 TRINITY_DN131_c0_g1_i4:587-892(-)